MAEKTSEANKRVLKILEGMKAQEEAKNKKKKKKRSIRPEKGLQYYSGWSPKV